MYQRSAFSDEFLGYGLCGLPTRPGMHEVSCPIWAALDNRKSGGQRVFSAFTGHYPSLSDESFVPDGEKRFSSEKSQFLETVGTGRVHLRLHVMFKVGARCSVITPVVVIICCLIVTVFILHAGHTMRRRIVRHSTPFCPDLKVANLAACHVQGRVGVIAAYSSTFFFDRS